MKTRPSEHALAEIRLLLMDVDGVLTDGSIHIDGSGQEVKTFHVHDGAGLVYWHRAGGLSGFVSGRRSKVVTERAAELGVHEVHLGSMHKMPIVEDILARRALGPEQIAYVGDDISDIPVLRVAGFAATVPEARPEVFEHVHHVTAAPGGRGAIREVVELLLKARRAWDDVLRRGGVP
jgi:3-deoxy-D-manno-octulosonate 8-phosphate phosphatase (KDO 8-P phosphatase)